MSKRRKEEGFTLLEALLAGTLMFFALVGFMSMMMVQASSVEMSKRISRAHDAADSALEKLASYQLDSWSPLGGSFELAADNQIQLSACSAQWCDELYAEDDISVRGTGGYRGPANHYSLAGGTTWGTGAAPDNGRLEFVRRWRIERVPERPDLRQLTVAVLVSEESTQPLVIQSTRVVERLMP